MMSLQDRLPGTYRLVAMETRTTAGDVSRPMGERPTLGQAASMIDAAVEAADRYYPAFDFMIRGNKKPQEAIDSCLFETVGTA